MRQACMCHDKTFHIAHTRMLGSAAIRTMAGDSCQHDHDTMCGQAAGLQLPKKKNFPHREAESLTSLCRHKCILGSAAISIMASDSSQHDRDTRCGQAAGQQLPQEEKLSASRSGISDKSLQA